MLKFKKIILKILIWICLSYRLQQNVRTTRKVNSERTFPIPLQKFLANLKTPFQWKKFKHGKTSKCLKTQNKCKNSNNLEHFQTAGLTNQTIQTNIQELSGLNGIDFNDLGSILSETTKYLLHIFLQEQSILIVVLVMEFQTKITQKNI